MGHSLLASGDKASKVRIWDIRSLNRHVVQLSQHQDRVYHVKWCPYNKYLLASSGNDRMLFMYDLRRSGWGKGRKKGTHESAGMGTRRMWTVWGREGVWSRRRTMGLIPWR